VVASSLLHPTDKITLEEAFRRMRAIIRSCPTAEANTMRAPFNALGALEQIALHAPQNSGRLRTLQYELRDELTRFAAASNAIATDLQLQTVFAEIVRILRKPEPAVGRSTTEILRMGSF
jgi:hypothetical protein